MNVEATIQEAKSLLSNHSCYYKKAQEISESVMLYKKQQNIKQIQLGYKELRNSCLEIVGKLLDILDDKDEYTREHCQRVTKLALAIGQELELSKEDLLYLEFAGLLHDLGKIAVPDEILNKNGKLSQQEYEIVKLHPTIGYHLIKDLSFMMPSCEILLQHHERVDGKGYPFGITGEQIDIKARVLAVADAYDAMTSSRPYRKAGMSSKDAVYEIEQYKGTQFDEEIADVLKGLVEYSLEHEIIHLQL